MIVLKFKNMLVDDETLDAVRMRVKRQMSEEPKIIVIGPNIDVYFSDDENIEVVRADDSISIEWCKQFRRNLWNDMRDTETFENRSMMCRGIRLMLEKWEAENEVD